VRRPVLGDEVLEMNAANLAHAHVTVVIHNYLQEPHQMLRWVLELPFKKYNPIQNQPSKHWSIIHFEFGYLFFDHLIFIMKNLYLLQLFIIELEMNNNSSKNAANYCPKSFHSRKNVLYRGFKGKEWLRNLVEALLRSLALIGVGAKSSLEDDGKARKVHIRNIEFGSKKIRESKMIPI
jgi:hypothetical protein